MVYSIDNQRNELKTRAKCSRDVVDPARLFGLIRFTLEPSKFTFKIFTYFQLVQQYLRDYRLLQLLSGVKKLKTNAKCVPSVWVRRNSAYEKRTKLKGKWQQKIVLFLWNENLKQ